MGRRLGITEEQLGEMGAYKASSSSPPRTRSPVEVSEELFAVLERHLNEAQMVELAAFVAWENYRARFNHALGIEAEDFSKGAYCVLPGG